MPYKNEIQDGTTSPAQNLAEKVQALRADVKRLERVRDTALAQAKTAEAAGRTGAALQAEIDRARERLEQAEQELRGAQAAE